MMFRRIGLVPIIAAAAFVVAGCEPGPVEGPANNAAAAEANGAASNTASAQGAPTGGTCGTIAGIQCGAATDFCKTAVDQCGVQDAEGVCTTRPRSCIALSMPVCGCDGQTYGNACEADRAGVNVRATGACPGAASSETNSAAQ